MKFILQIYTPLWTGSTDTKKMDRIHETGISGSLRWWYETILRGLTGTNPDREQVCNATSENAIQRCNYERNRWVCRACDLFGATGWKRRFRIDINNEKQFVTPGKITIKINPNGNGWHFYPHYISVGSQNISGQIHVLRQRSQVNPIERISSVENDLYIIAALINRWGGLGSKTQHGWGIVNLQFENHPQADINSFLVGLPDDNTDDQGLPTIGNMFFAQLYLKSGIADNWWKSAHLGNGVKDNASQWRLEDSVKAKTSFSVPSAPAVKYKLRYGNNGSSYLPAAVGCEEFFFGQIGNQAIKAKLNISNAYNVNGQWQFRVWGWFPEQEIPGSISRNLLVTQLQQVITDTKYQNFWDSIFGAGVIDLSKSVWREVDRSGHNRNSP
ncbi:MAG: type III-B CRISPR module RAMP protein Cmr1, partial [Acidobacteriota bacterium]